MTKSPLVSIIIPTYKRADMLSRAIDSVLSQTYNNIEIIVVDDNIPESKYRKETEAIMDKYLNDNRIIYIKHERNMNGSVARNTGIKASEGELICFLDDDDYYLHQKIEKQVSYMLLHPEYEAVYCGWQCNNKTTVPNKVGNLTYEVLMGSHMVYTITIMMKKSAITSFGGWDEKYIRNQEAAFILRFFKEKFKIGVVQDALVFIDKSDRSNSVKPKISETLIEEFLEKHSDQIAECEKEHSNARKNIYSVRYRSILLEYLKNKDFFNVLRVYKKAFRYAPLIWNKHMFIGAIRKITGRDLFEYAN